MKLSVSSYSFCQYIDAGKMTQADAVERAAAMGFSGIEFTELAPKKDPTFDEQMEYAKEIRARAARAGIAVVSYAVGADLLCTGEAADAAIERLCRQADIAAALGAPLMRHDVCYSQKLGGRVLAVGAMIPILAENVRRVTEYAESIGVRTCTENHGFILQDSVRIEALLGAVDHKNYGYLCDVGNFACADEDSAAAVSRLAPLAIHVHVKDFCITPFGEGTPDGSFLSRGCRSLLGCAVGEGDIPVARCIAILRRAGYDGFMSIEYEGPEDCIEGIAKGKKFLDAIL